MRVSPVLPALLPCVAVAAFAQGQADPIKYVSKTDYFSIDFPGTPKVQEITYPDEYRITLPGRVYTSDAGRNRYKVTVIDYRGALQIHAARNAKCLEDAGANRPGLTPQQRRDLVGDSCQDDGVKDIRGAMMYATWAFVEIFGVVLGDEKVADHEGETAVGGGGGTGRAEHGGQRQAGGRQGRSEGQFS